MKKPPRPRTTILRHRLAIAAVCGSLPLATAADLGTDPHPPSPETEYRQVIEADWLQQLARACSNNDGSRITPEMDAAGACDGVKDEETGFHTDRQENPWWQVDLGKSAPLTRIVLHNARDCRERARNLRILVSEEGNTWQEVHRQDGRVFGGATDGNPLVVPLQDKAARFVRVTLPDTEYLHLNEVEVYAAGDPDRNLALGKRATQSSVSKWSTAPADWQPGLRPEAVKVEATKALNRAEQLRVDLSGTPGVPDLHAEAAALQALRAEVSGVDAADADAAQALYLRIRRVGRELALKNPLLISQPILFLMRPRYAGHGQMLYEYVGWFYRNGPPRSDAGVYVLEEPGRSMKTRTLVPNSALQGHFVTLSLSYDAQKVYFAFADPSGKPSYGPGFVPVPEEPGVKYGSFHLMAVNADGSQLRQLTDGPRDDFDPCPLPDGGIAFMSTRRGGKNRCGGGNPEAIHVLHRMDADGNNIRTLSFHETNEWHPFVLNDGRLIYTRWDYVDRDAACFHGLWTCNPDGSTPAILFGNYTRLPWACYQPKPIPGSRKILFVGGGHHSIVGGTLCLLDPDRVELDSQTGEDRREAFECLTPGVCFPEAQGWPKSYFYSPWPLSENHYLVAFSHEPLSGQYTGTAKEGETGLYYYDRFGNLELLFRREGISAAYPIPFAPRACPPNRVSPANPDLGDEGEFLLSNVNESLYPMPVNRPIVQLRVFQLLPKSRTDNQSDPPISHQFAYGPNARMLLGTVPVESDGSAYFRAPAGKPLYFQAVDNDGRAVQSMRSLVYLQPGERRSCVGCHERPGTVSAPHQTLAFARPPSTLEPGPDGTLPFGYPRLIQPILDRHCVRCHDGSSGPDKSELVLSGEPSGKGALAWNRSYKNLEPYLGLHMPTVSLPGQIGADRSKLAGVLTDEAHRKYIELPDAELRTIYLWLDANAPYYGSYEVPDLLAQKLGREIAPPVFQ
ncbi:MAG: discoidin domain-containing protein [Verrucomicrobiales bacterium]|nr:discoidin domain-containing protein [Verrucomicrobiales bacterium]